MEGVEGVEGVEGGGWMVEGVSNNTNHKPVLIIFD